MIERPNRFTRQDLLAAVALTALNLTICWRLFTIEYANNLSSIEGAWVGIASYLSRHWSDSSWWPLWHCGMPYQDTYVPLLHLAAALTAMLGKVSAAHAYHAVCAIMYSLGPVTLYFMASRLGKSRGAAFVAALVYSLFSPSTLLMPNIAHDVGGFWNGRRLQVMVIYGEGPHVAAMTLLPLAILALQAAVWKRNWRSLALAALPLGAIFATNVPGSMATAVAVFCWLCIQPAIDRKAAWSLAAAAGIFGYALACYGVPPSSLRTVVGNVGTMHAGFSAAMRSGPLWLGITLAGTLAIGWLLARTRVPLLLRFALLYFATLAAMVLSAVSDKFEILPQVGRLHLEMELAICLIVGTALWYLYRLVPVWTHPIVLAICLAPVYIQFENYRVRARSDIAPIDITQRSEYTSARWVDTNLPGQRTYAVGSTSFWWNAFTDTPQMMGCCSQNQAMPVLDEVAYIIGRPLVPDQTPRIKPYLQALGVQAMVVPGPESNDEYKDIQQPERLEPLFPVLHRERGDTIYAIPQRTKSLAHVIRAEDVVPTPLPHLRASSPAVIRYAAALQDESRPLASFDWMSGGKARIAANLTAQDLISVQVAWFNGWRARANGRSIPITEDGIGFQVLHPACQGACEITLEWSGPPDRWPTAVLSLLALAGAAMLLFGTYAGRPVAWVRHLS